MERVICLRRSITIDEAVRLKEQYINEFEKEDEECKEPYATALEEFFALTDKYNINLSILPLYLDFFYCATIARLLDFTDQAECKHT